jgi:hypothetical protein
MYTHTDPTTGETIYTCPLCSEAMLYWQQGSHNATKHGNILASYSYSVEGSRDYTCCEYCAMYVVENWELVRREGFDQWLVDPAKYESDIRITRNFSNAQLWDFGCDLCNDRLS